MSHKKPLRYTVEEFRADIFILANENQQLADQLYEKLKENLIEEITAHTNAEVDGTPHAERVFNRIKRNEHRKHREKLAYNLGNRPTNTEAHHIVAISDQRAQRARQILIEFDIDIDSKENGVYLPAFKSHKPHPSMPKAHAHREVHSRNYYRDVNNMLTTVAQIDGANKDDIIKALDRIRNLLIEGKMKLK